IEIISGGVPGWGQDQELLFYRYEGYKYQADLVLQSVYPNDLFENVPGLLEAGLPQEKPYFELQGQELVLRNFPYGQVRPADAAEGGAALGGLRQQLSAGLHTHSRTYRTFVPIVRQLTSPREVRKPCWWPGLPVPLMFFAADYPPELQQAVELTTRLLEETGREAASHGAKYGVVA